MKNLIKEIREEIEKQGGVDSFPNSIKKDRPNGCPMKRMMIDELQELTKFEIHIAFTLGLIGNNGHDGTIVKNSKKRL